MSADDAARPASRRAGGSTADDDADRPGSRRVGGSTSTAATRPRPGGSSARRRPILTVLALALLALASGVPVWVRTAGTTVLRQDVPVTVSGTQAAPAVPAAALVLLAAGLAIGLAGRAGRWVVVGAVLVAGLLQVASAAAILADPEPVARTVVAAATGIETLTAPAALTPWPWVAVVVGLFVLAAGGWLAATSGRWVRPSDRHDLTRATPDRVVPDDDQAAWDALTRGDDPT